MCSSDLTGLANGTSYLFRVSAANAVGESPFTAPVAGIPASTPTAPQSISALAGNGEVTLAWTAPSSAGGSPVLRYVVERYDTGSSSWVIVDNNVTALSLLVTGLTNGTSYLFRVSAINSAGTGASTALATSVTPATVPSAAVITSTFSNNTSVQINWSAAASNGSAITG